MSFTKFLIKNYKCFREEQTLYFAIPNPEIDGSGITYIVGANNSGKTTLIEGLAIKNSNKIKASERIQGLDPEFKLYEGETLKRKCNLIRSESFTIEESPTLGEGEKFEIISSRRHWASGAGSTFRNLGDGLRNTYDFQRQQSNVEVASELKTIEADNTKYAEFISLVQRVIPEFTKFAVGYEDNEYIEYISGLGVRHKTELLGDGVITVIRILLQLYIAKQNPLVIDEPELSLHPSAQKKLLQVIAEFSKNRQIIISTHSPYFINWKYLQNGAVLNRVVKFEDKESKVFSINDFTKYNTLVAGANWQQPFLLDEVAKEIFFTEDKIVFLEGQEDVGLLRQEQALSSGNIFGYGVRGKDNFKFALQLAKDLGYQKVSCILDNGVSESSIKTDLERDFPDYKIVQWNKDDIRDKSSYTTSAKEGYFTSEGIIKPSEQLDDFNAKLGEITTYFNE